MPMPTDTENQPLHYAHFEQVTNQLLDGYVRLVEVGYPPSTIASAMLTATVNMHQLLAAGEHLPDILRQLADQLDASAEDSTYPFWITLTRN